ncbi:DNA adenine methylase [Sphingomonas sp. MG17]|uniref:site-specific DNA-methyltransferase (adenine-specific) n=1 Tax=Sphingomonas tagetis TaxID=2949092 RepID=A0A9X2KK56_9SPHN|nr:DNA adenine methylase [Sphingomonas tagetis]MCP3729237.1 DNA adenine methylase [Sphingomonas tagetis]
MSSSAAVQTPAGYIGGKRFLARRLVELIEATPHRTYAEPFVGMGGVFLKRRSPAKAEAINDISRDVVNLFRVVRRHRAAIEHELRWMFTSREEFERLQRVDPTTLTDIERAARFLYLQRLAFGGKVVGQNFGVARERPASFNPAQLVDRLANLHDRLARVSIERLPYADFIRRYDSAETLFYLDPPYWGCEGDYGAGVFDSDDFARLAELLGRVSGRFILSINDAPEIRAAFAQFEISAAETTYAIAASGSKKVTELIIRN